MALIKHMIREKVFIYVYFIIYVCMVDLAIEIQDEEEKEIFYEIFQADAKKNNNNN